MPSYQVALIEVPPGWAPDSPDDVPAEPGKVLETAGQFDGLFPALRRAIELNEGSQRGHTGRWAVVTEPGSIGRVWRSARLCSPVRYKVTAIWWPPGWEPNSPFDVPNCAWRAQGDTGRQGLSYKRALATVRGLNRQAMANAGATWYVIVAVENEPISHTVSYDASGAETTVEVRRLHVVRPDPTGTGDCSHCPAHCFDCAREQWVDLAQTDETTQTRAAT